MPSESLPSAVRAAQYLRMSTDLQSLSIGVQKDMIELFAQRRGFEVVETYEDAGRSGLSIANRPGLQKLISDVASGQAGFAAILVYDVSRWGRFQDIDEAAHFEFLCRQMGINVHYCAELFDNDGSSVSSIIKTMKRIMAAEYSRELSTKVRASQERLIAKGFWVSGSVPYGYARLIVDARGRSRGLVLDAGQRKNVKNDRIVLVPGPLHQVENVRRIFDLYVKEGLGRREISNRMNDAGRRVDRERPWTESAVGHILRNEIYIGNIVWGRTHKPLGGKRSGSAAPSDVIRIPNAVEPLVDTALFNLAQDVAEHRTVPKGQPPKTLLEQLRKLMERNGELARSLIYYEPEILYSAAYHNAFGSMRQAFGKLGYEKLPRYRVRLRQQKIKNIRWQMVDTLLEEFRSRGITAGRDDSFRHISIGGRLKLAIVLMRVQQTYHIPDCWNPARYNADAALVIRAWQWRDDPVDYYFVGNRTELEPGLPPPSVDLVPAIAEHRIASIETVFRWAAERLAHFDGQ